MSIAFAIAEIDYYSLYLAVPSIQFKPPNHKKRSQNDYDYVDNHHNHALV